MLRAELSVHDPVLLQALLRGAVRAHEVQGWLWQLAGQDWSLQELSLCGCQDHGELLGTGIWIQRLGTRCDGAMLIITCLAMYSLMLRYMIACQRLHQLDAKASDSSWVNATSIDHTGCLWVSD